MQKHDFQCEHLKQLPFRAIVAFSVRCARRVQSLSELPEDYPGRQRLRDDVEHALGMAEGYANGASILDADAVVEAIDASRRDAGVSVFARAAAAAVSETAHAAASAWYLTGSPESENESPREIKTAEARKFLGGVSRVSADLAALNAFSAAIEAYEAVGMRNEEFVASALRDYDTLLRLKLGRYPDAGAPIDASPVGPLGPL